MLTPFGRVACGMFYPHPSPTRTRCVRRVGGVCVGAWRGGGGANQGLVSFAALTKAHPIVTPFGFLQFRAVRRRG